MTILAEIYGDPVFFGSGPGFVNRTQSDPGFVNPIRSSPGFVNPIRSDPVQVLLTPQKKYFLSFQPRISSHPKKGKNNNKVHKRNTGIDYYSISLMAFNLNML